MYTVKAYYFNRNFKPIVKNRLTHIGAKICAERLYANNDAITSVTITNNHSREVERKWIV